MPNERERESVRGRDPRNPTVCFEAQNEKASFSANSRAPDLSVRDRRITAEVWGTRRTNSLAKGAECRESTFPSVPGEKHSLDIPFYRTRHSGEEEQPSHSSRLQLLRHTTCAQNFVLFFYSFLSLVYPMRLLQVLKSWSSPVLINRCTKVSSSPVIGAVFAAPL
jgi:hypothetical protein